LFPSQKTALPAGRGGKRAKKGGATGQYWPVLRWEGCSAVKREYSMSVALWGKKEGGARGLRMPALNGGGVGRGGRRADKKL